MYLCELFLLAHVIYGGVPRVGAAAFYIKYTLAFQDVAAMFGVIYMSRHSLLLSLGVDNLCMP